MPRKIKFVIEDHFEVAADKSHCICKFSGCNRVFKGVLPSNLKRHVTTMHRIIKKCDESSGGSSTSAISPIIRSQTKPQRKLIQIPMDSTTLYRACMKMVTVDGLPFRILESEGFIEIIRPISNALGITVNADSIVAYIKSIACAMKQIISEELKHKFFCLKMDVATRYGRSVLVVNAQFISGDEIHVRTLGMVELTTRQTADNLKIEVERILTAFECSLKQVYSCTTDNGGNMLKSVKLLVEDVQEAEYKGDSNDNDEDIMTTLDVVLLGNLRCIRCASHTIQLAVNDVIEKHDTKIKTIREIVKAVRSEQFKQLLTLSGVTVPSLDVPTRWISTYIMVKSLNDNISFYQTLQNGRLIDDEVSDFIADFVTAFTPVYVCTQQLQVDQFIFGDFVCAWMELEMNLSTINNQLAEQMFATMKIRAIGMLNDDVCRAALYIDQRFNFLGSSSQYLSTEGKIEAQDYLLKVYETICAIPNPRDELELFYDSILSTTSLDVTTHSKVVSMRQQLCELENRPRVPLNTNIIDMWHTSRFQHPELYNLAMTVLAAPASQVSVERAFSAIALVLTNSTAMLKKDTLDDMLIIKLNSILLENISPNEFETI